MRVVVALLFVLAISSVKAQDKIIMLDGSSVSGKVEEIGPDKVSVSVDGETLDLHRLTILLIEYKNGSVEMFNQPANDLQKRTDEPSQQQTSKRGTNGLNFASFNTLGPVNADLPFFYEHVFGGSPVGAGVMAAYNLNPYVTYYNGWLNILANAKKKYDIGAFVNYYPGKFKKKNNLFYGILFKYTPFNFSHYSLDTTYANNVAVVTVHYKPSAGYQFATIFTGGFHTTITDNFFIRTMAGLGWFNLKGDYKQQVDYLLNINRKTNEPAYDIRLMPKVYVALNVGFSF